MDFVLYDKNNFGECFYLFNVSFLGKKTILQETTNFHFVQTTNKICSQTVNIKLFGLISILNQILDDFHYNRRIRIQHVADAKYTTAAALFAHVLLGDNFQKPEFTILLNKLQLPHIYIFITFNK